MMARDYTQLITSEHNQQPKFMALVGLLTGAIGQISDVAASFNTLFDIDTAVGQQLDMIGLWVGQSRKISGILVVGFFGFQDDQSALGFGELGDNSVGGRFLELGESQTASAVLQDPEYRLALKAKIITNQFKGTAMELAEAVMEITGVPFAFFDPSTRIVIAVALQPVDPTLATLMLGFGLIPQPIGTQYAVMQPQNETWLLSSGNAAIDGASIYKQAGANDWDTTAYLNSPQYRQYLTWTVPTADKTVAAGFANESPTPASPSDLVLGVQIDNGNILAISGGSTMDGFGTYQPGDKFAIIMDGAYFTLWHNGSLVYQAQSNQLLIPALMMYSLGAQFDNVFSAVG